MSSLYCMRHGQAGLRGNYDALSETGRRQAMLLGEHLASEKIVFQAFFTGELTRQIETAREIQSAYERAGIPLPEPRVSPFWNEFDLTAVYDEIAPQLAADNADFRREYEALEREAADAQSAVHRRWTPSDIAVVKAWVGAHYPSKCESWIEFKDRVRGAFDSIAQFNSGENIAISTSATPIAVWLGLALNLENPYIMRSAGVLYNASISIFRMRDKEPYVLMFNSIPHLTTPALRTFR